MKIGKSGETAGDLRDQGRCPMCTLPVVKADFKTPLDMRESQISGLCQGCIDVTFAEPPKSRQEVLDEAANL